MNAFLKFDSFFDPAILQQDLARCLALNWTSHFNSKNYAGDWTAIALRSHTGSATDIVATGADTPYADTDLLRACPYFSAILEGFAFETEAVRLMRLAPGSVIKPHRDLGLAYRYGVFRLHIPVVTGPGVHFTVGDARVPMQAGECWYADFDLLHSVRNDTDKARIHLVIDGKRNAWTDDFFRAAGYDFEKEAAALMPHYDLHTLEGMLREFAQMDSPAALQCVADIREQIAQRKRTDSHGNTTALMARWIPAQLVKDNPLKIRAVFAGTKRFTEPFFDETLAACRAFPENLSERLEYAVADFLAEAEAADAPEPSAFIFHVSRCGSTLLTQMLNEDARCITLAEVPLLDELLCLSETEYGLEAGTAARLFKAAVRLLSRRVTGMESHVFIKCDSWHNVYIEKIRALYPSVPFVFLYRTPEDVMHSQMKLPGMQAMPGAVNPAIFGFTLSDIVLDSRDVYFAKVLQIYFEQYQRAITQDTNAHLVCYHEGAAAMLRRIAEVSGLMLDAGGLEKILARTQYHSKMPAQVFHEAPAPRLMPEQLQKSNAIFQDLEARRVSSAAMAC